MQVEELDPSGKVVRIMRIPGYPLELTDAQVAAERNSRLDMDLPPGMTLPPFIRRIAEALPAPATRPAYAEMLVDPSGAVWLELYRGAASRIGPRNGWSWTRTEPGSAPLRSRTASGLRT